MTQHHVAQRSFHDEFAKTDPLRRRTPRSGFAFCSPCHGSGRLFEPPRCCNHCGGSGQQLLPELQDWVR